MQVKYCLGIFIYWRHRVDYGEQDDTTCLVPQFTCYVVVPSEICPQRISMERSKTASPGAVLQRAMILFAINVIFLYETGPIQYFSAWWALLAWGHFKKANELLNLRTLKFSHVNKMHIFQCMVKIFCVEFQREPLKFHTKYLTHTLKDAIFIQRWNFKSSWI